MKLSTNLKSISDSRPTFIHNAKKQDTKESKK